MPGPQFANTRTADPTVNRDDVRAFADQVGRLAGAKILGFDGRRSYTRYTIAGSPTVTKVAHGMGYAPFWLPFMVEGLITPGQIQAPDDTYLYLIADVPVVCGIIVF